MTSGEGQWSNDEMCRLDCPIAKADLATCYESCVLRRILWQTKDAHFEVCRQPMGHNLRMCPSSEYTCISWQFEVAGVIDCCSRWLVGWQRDSLFLSCSDVNVNETLVPSLSFFPLASRCLSCHGHGFKTCSVCHGSQNLMHFIQLTVTWWHSPTHTHTHTKKNTHLCVF